MAWLTLQAIWQKLFPDWPVAVIGLRTIFTMKLFAHCGKDDKRMLVDYCNKFLKASALRAANRDAPMDFERSLNLAGNVCHQKGYEREPPATRTVSQSAGNSSQTQARGGFSNPRGRGVNRGMSSGNRPTGFANPSLPSGQKICNYWQTGSCNFQNQQSCMRGGVKYAHACSFIKAGGVICAKNDHKKSEHDVTKH